MIAHVQHEPLRYLMHAVLPYELLFSLHLTTFRVAMTRVTYCVRPYLCEMLLLGANQLTFYTLPNVT